MEQTLITVLTFQSHFVFLLADEFNIHVVL